MAWLLDTHTWIWSQSTPAMLGPVTRSRLVSGVHVATFSTLELARLVWRGHLVLSCQIDEWVARGLAALDAVSLEMSHAVAREAYTLPEPFHRDPADRVLVATARVHDLTLLTSDQPILAYPHVRSADARL